MRYEKHGLCGVCGVYLIENQINGKRYVGSSVNIGSRISQHFTSAVRKYKNINEMYREFHEFGRDNFSIRLLEVCEPCDKLETERKWYEKISPEYNQVPPSECPFTHEVVREKSKAACETSEFQEKRLASHRTARCRNLCRENMRDKMIPCIGRGETDTPVFESLSEAARWLNRESALACVVSNIKESITSKSRKAYGYRWEVMPNEDNS